MQEREGPDAPSAPAVKAAELLVEPKPGAALNDIKGYLNALAKRRDSDRLSFCKWLAIVYLMIVGHRPLQCAKVPPEVQKFYAWCAENLRSGRGKQYAVHSIKAYVSVGFSGNPENRIAVIRAVKARGYVASVEMAEAIKRAVKTNDPLKAVPVTQLRKKFNLPTNVANEVNVLMTAWEQASVTARSQFIYMVTGRRVAA